MPNYSYKARDEQGRVFSGIIAAQNENELFAELRRQGQYLIEHKLTKSVPVSVSARRFGALNSQDLLHFTEELSISLEAGVTLLQSLKNLIKNEKKSRTKSILDNIAYRVEAGSSFKEALEAHPQSFPKLYVSVVGAGERTGKMHLVLRDLANFIEWQLEMKAKVTEASVYPIILFLTLFGVVTVLVAVVIPKFEPMFKDLGVGLPLPTIVILSLSRFVSGYWWLLALGLGALIGGFIFAFSTAQGRYRIDKFMLGLPVAGSLINKIALSRFCHTFALSLSAGIDVYTALGMAAEVVDNSFLERAISNARTYVNTGEKISDSLSIAIKEAGSEFPDIVISMIDVGEQTGNLVATLNKVNEYYEKEVPSTTRKIFSMFEPLMIVTMGVVVGGIALAVFLPMIQLISNVGE
ncbi:MAG TPA: type II secretion system F family protein [Candidatus Omnitrophota bacterium]|nr:type II secretion system F family protein [Candidatus Omnitrophota bacterium]